MKSLKKIIIIIILASSLFVLNGKVNAQTTTLTPTSVVTSTLTPTNSASGSGTLTPTKITSLPKTGIVQYSMAFAVVSIGVILFALIF